MLTDVITLVVCVWLLALSIWLSHRADVDASRRENTALRKALAREREENRRNAARMAARRVHARWG